MQVKHFILMVLFATLSGCYYPYIEEYRYRYNCCRNDYYPVLHCNVRCVACPPCDNYYECLDNPTCADVDP